MVKSLLLESLMAANTRLEVRGLHSQLVIKTLQTQILQPRMMIDAEQTILSGQLHALGYGTGHSYQGMLKEGKLRELMDLLFHELFPQ